MSWWADFWKKPASVAGHFAWGFLVAALAWRYGAPPVICLLAAWIAGILWEVIPELYYKLVALFGFESYPEEAKAQVKTWSARAWDVTPWFLGGIAQVAFWWGL